MKDRLKKSLALKVKALRESQAMTQEDLADKCEVSWRSISNLERGIVVPDLYMVYKIAEIFHVTIDEMLGLDVDVHKSFSRLEKEQLLIEKMKNTDDKTLNYFLEHWSLITKYFG